MLKFQQSWDQKLVIDEASNIVSALACRKESPGFELLLVTKNIINLN
jgi:hypothetical protein